MQETGERMMPETSGAPEFWEHLYRYKFACGHVRGRRVLDIACGEGYGASALLASGASSVIGIDLSEESCRHAREKYSVDARTGDAMAIPLPNASADVVVSFETVEHVPDPQRFIAECARVLSGNGTLIISTPNVDVYNPGRDPGHNPYHCSELSLSEFVELVGEKFGRIELYSQTYLNAPLFSVYGLHSRRSPWRKVRGYTRFVSAQSPDGDPTREQTARQSPVQEILRSESWLQRLCNPFAVRPHRSQLPLEAMYFVIVATSPRHDATELRGKLS